MCLQNMNPLNAGGIELSVATIGGRIGPHSTTCATAVAMRRAEVLSDPVLGAQRFGCV
jgi:hypothetical protein